MSAKKSLLIWIAVCSFPLSYFLWGWAHSESYCFLYPGIDTRFAPGYSESAFSQVSTGMTTLAVEKFLGKPLFTGPTRDGRTCWNYTGDGKCMIGNWRYADFAWLGRAVYFRDGRVVEVFKYVYYD